jgi:hypothetical protein
MIRVPTIRPAMKIAILIGVWLVCAIVVVAALSNLSGLWPTARLGTKPSDSVLAITRPVYTVHGVVNTAKADRLEITVPLIPDELTIPGLPPVSHPSPAKTTVLTFALTPVSMIAAADPDPADPAKPPATNDRSLLTPGTPVTVTADRDLRLSGRGYPLATTVTLNIVSVFVTGRITDVQDDSITIDGIARLQSPALETQAADEKPVTGSFTIRLTPTTRIMATAGKLTAGNQVTAIAPLRQISAADLTAVTVTVLTRTDLRAVPTPDSAILSGKKPGVGIPAAAPVQPTGAPAPLPVAK